MRTAILHTALLFCLAVGQARAQFPSFPDSNALWIMEVFDGPQFQYAFSYHMRATNHDTLIDGNWYSTIWSGLLNQAGFYCGGVREDIDSRVYLYPANGSSEYLLYHFNPAVGDTLFVWVGDPLGAIDPSVQMMHVATVESLTNANGTSWNLIGVMSDAALIGGQGVTQYWLQGVGGSGGLFNTIGSLTISISESLACMQHNDSIWPAGVPGLCSPMNIAENASNGIVLFPNPNNGRFTITFTEPHTTARSYGVYDALGKLLVQRSLPPGLSTSEIDLSHFGAGSYLIKVSSPKAVWHAKVLLE
ncbi:MAG: T9SS type A sorting domain-containing protein [Flavobacteriales bacterium]